MYGPTNPRMICSLLIGGLLFHGAVTGNGESGKRGLRTYVQLFLAIGRANNLTCDIARDSTRVYAYGFESDIEAVEALYASLVVQMVRQTLLGQREVPNLRRTRRHCADARTGWYGCAAYP